VLRDFFARVSIIEDGFGSGWPLETKSGSLDRFSSTI